MKYKTWCNTKVGGHRKGMTGVMGDALCGCVIGRLIARTIKELMTNGQASDAATIKKTL